MYTFTFTLLLVISSTLLSQINANHVDLDECTVDANSQNMYNFPHDAKSKAAVKYSINYNLELHQANYVKYIGTRGLDSVGQCAYLTNDSNPEIDYYHDSDYDLNNILDGHDATQLVPKSDFGNVTCYTANTVLMLINFYNNVWSKSEKFIQDHFFDYTIYKGCDYDTNVFVTTTTGKIMYIPTGCYYVVMDAVRIIDYGYFEHNDIKNQVKEFKLPWWVTCEGVAHHSTDDTNDKLHLAASIISIITSIVAFLTSSSIGSYIVYMVIRNRRRLGAETTHIDDDAL
jgi:hypothetical protein